MEVRNIVKEKEIRDFYGVHKVIARSKAFSLHTVFIGTSLYYYIYIYKCIDRQILWYINCEDNKLIVNSYDGRTTTIHPSVRQQ